jgi:hypothetical protein
MYISAAPATSIYEKRKKYFKHFRKAMTDFYQEKVVYDFGLQIREWGGGSIEDKIVLNLKRKFGQF